MKLQILIVCVCIVYNLPSQECKPASDPTAAFATTLVPSEKTPPPWLKFLKNKKTTANPPTQTSTESSLLLKGSKTRGKGINFERALSPSPTLSPSESNQLADWLGIYLQPSGDVLAEDRNQNPDSLYDEMYLDWMKKKRQLGLDGGTNNGDVTVSDAQPQPMVQQIPPSTYGYPAPIPFYNPFFPLAGFKMQKAMVQAQMDAALAAYNITTTTKPLKLKLKITVPGNMDMMQLSQLTSSLTNSLPPGSTYEVA